VAARELYVPGLRAFQRVPYRWRYALVVAVPLAVSTLTYIVVDEWTVWVGIVTAIVGVLLVATSHGSWLRSVTETTLDVRGVDSERRVVVHLASEEARLANAINRLADTAIAALSRESANRRYHETIMDTIDDGILVVDSAGGLVYSNSVAQSIFGFSSTLADGDQPQPLTAKVNVIEVSDAARECLRNGSAVRSECTLYNPTRHLDVLAAPVDGDEKSGRRALLVVLDKTDEHRLSETMNEFIANASHELRTPITVMLSTVDALRFGGQLTAVEDEFLGQMQASARKMGVLVDELLDLTMFDTGQTALHLVPTDVAAIVAATCEELLPVAEKQGIELNVDSLCPGLIVNADVDKLQRVLANLLTNAIKFSAPGSVAEIGCEARCESVVIWVKDQGRGIDAEHLPHVFDRFFRTQPDVGDEPGFGLGLAIVKNLVELLGGTVEVQSTLGVGSTFTITLPAMYSRPAREIDDSLR